MEIPCGPSIYHRAFLRYGLTKWCQQLPDPARSWAAHQSHLHGCSANQGHPPQLIPGWRNFSFTSDFFSQAFGNKYSFQSYRSARDKYWSLSKAQDLTYDANFCVTGGNLRSMAIASTGPTMNREAIRRGVTSLATRWRHNWSIGWSCRTGSAW